MERQPDVMEHHHRPFTSGGARARLLAGVPVAERWLEVDGVSTAVSREATGHR